MTEKSDDRLSDMTKSVVCYGIDEALIDLLLEHMSASIELNRWFVYGSNVKKLGLLEKYWNQFTEVTMVITPPSLKPNEDFIELILEAQKVNLHDCYWISNFAPPESLKNKFRFCFDVSEFLTFKEFVEHFSPMVVSGA